MEFQKIISIDETGDLRQYESHEKGYVRYFHEQTVIDLRRENTKLKEVARQAAEDVEHWKRKALEALK